MALEGVFRESDDVAVLGVFDGLFQGGLLHGLFSAGQLGDEAVS